jgi:hypothetical protein
MRPSFFSSCLKTNIYIYIYIYIGIYDCQKSIFCTFLHQKSHEYFSNVFACSFLPFFIFTRLRMRLWGLLPDSWGIPLTSWMNAPLLGTRHVLNNPKVALSGYKNLWKMISEKKDYLSHISHKDDETIIRNTMFSRWFKCKFMILLTEIVTMIILNAYSSFDESL